MKLFLQKLYHVGLTIIPICAIFMLSGHVNTTTCWHVGQEHIPAAAKKYRKF